MAKRRKSIQQHVDVDDAGSVKKKQCTTTTTTKKKRSDGPIPTRTVFRNYTSWNDIPNDIQCRVDVAKMALDKQWVNHLSEFPEQLQEDKEFRRYCIIKGFKQRWHRNNKTMTQTTTYCDCDYKELSEHWKEDRDVIRAAFKYKRATLKDIPETFLSDHDFLRQTLNEYPRFFSELPSHLRNDTEFWLSDLLSERLVVEILKTHRHLGADVEFWGRILEDNYFVLDYGAWLERFAPKYYQRDHDFMWFVLRHDTSTWLREYNHRFRLPILQDEIFVKKLYQNMSHWDFHSIPHILQLRFPHLMAEIVIPRVLEEFSLEDEEKEVQYFANSVLAPELWNHVNIVKAWFSNGGPFMERAIPEIWNLDPKGFLWIAKHCEEADAIQSFERAPDTLLDDKSFMMQVIKLQPKLYQAASRQLQDDIDLRMMVCSKVSSTDDLLSCGLSADVVKRTHEHIQERYNAYRAFEMYRSCVSHRGNTTSPITLLNQGPTTSVAYNSLVADYLGVPTGKELQMIQKCAEKIGNT